MPINPMRFELLEQRSDIQPQRSERIGVEPIRLSLRCSEKISDCSSTQSIQETKDAALLNDESSAAIQNRL